MIDDREKREAEWKAGRHTSADGKSQLLEKMDYEHLRNVIETFPDYNVSPLRKALRVKQREMISIVIEYLQYREERELKKKSRDAKKRAHWAKVARQALEIYSEATS